MAPEPLDLETKLRERKARVAIVGLGYAGLPMAIEIARSGYSVIGYDVDHRKVDCINEGRSPISSVSDDDVMPLRAVGILSATQDSKALGLADVVIICVPTPLTVNREPDLSFLQSAARDVGKHLRRGMLVILQSTCAPGTTNGLLRSCLERASGLYANNDFHLVFAPERIDPGNTRFTVANTPKLVGGVNDESTRLACLLFRTFIDVVVPVKSPEVAEMAKLVENTFRFINISFINEVALLCERLGVNVWEVIEAANTKPFAFMAHYPSHGVGGHCIPVVPLYLRDAALSLGISMRLIDASIYVNDAMPSMIVDKLEAALENRNKSLLGASVLVIGVTYKQDIADIRESAAIRVLKVALARGAHVAYHDPLIPVLTINDKTIHSVSLTASEIAKADAVILLTPHSGIDYELIMREGRLVIDTHSGFRPRIGTNVLNVWVPRTDDLSAKLLAVS